MITFRRFIVLQMLLVWQGGFLFYTAFVVPVGTQVLGSAAAQGVITARVTDTLNVLGVIGLAVMAWELLCTRDLARRRKLARWGCWLIALVCQGVLFYCHHRLDSYMNPERTHVVNYPPFYPTHRVYLWTCTVQWAACVLLALLTLLAWRGEDQRRSVLSPGRAADSSQG